MPGVVLEFLDVSRAHLHCKVLKDNVYIEAPKELGLDPSQCVWLKKCWFGTRDAGASFRVRCALRLRSEQLFTRSALFVRIPKQDTTAVVRCARRRLRGALGAEVDP